MRIRKYAAAAVMTVALSGVVAFATPAAASPPAVTPTTSAVAVDEAPSAMVNCEYYYDKGMYYYRLAAAYRSQGKIREAVAAQDVGDDFMARYRLCVS